MLRALYALEGFFRAARLQDPVADTGQHHAERTADVLLVVDDEHGGGSRGERRGGAGRGRGLTGHWAPFAPRNPGTREPAPRTRSRDTLGECGGMLAPPWRDPPSSDTSRRAVPRLPARGLMTCSARARTPRGRPPADIRLA